MIHPTAKPRRLLCYRPIPFLTQSPPPSGVNSAIHVAGCKRVTRACFITIITANDLLSCELFGSDFDAS